MGSCLSAPYIPTQGPLLSEQRRWHGADVLFVSLSPCEIYERKLTFEQLHAAIASLPDKQAKRIYAHYFLGMSKTAIAKAEGIGESTVRESIERGLRNIERYLKNIN